MFGNEKKQSTETPEKNIEKPTPSFLREDYPYKAIGDAITDLDSLQPTGVLYEIKCDKCELSIRSQGCNIKSTYERMINGVKVKKEDGTIKIEGGNGCIGCGNKNLIIREVDISKMAEIEANRNTNTKE